MDSTQKEPPNYTMETQDAGGVDSEMYAQKNQLNAYQVGSWTVPIYRV